MQVMSVIFAAINGIFRFIWGFLFDKFSFRLLMSIILVIQIIVAMTIPFIAEFVYVYIVENVFMAACLSGSFTLLAPIYNKTFGRAEGARLFGIIGPFIGIVTFLGPVISRLVVKENKDYTIFYMCCSILIILSFVLVILFKEEIYRDSKDPVAVELCFKKHNDGDNDNEEVNIKTDEREDTEHKESADLEDRNMIKVGK